MGYVTKVAHDGHEAVLVAQAFRPQVIVLDIGLPGLDGYEVATRLRADPDFSTVMFIALTGYSQAADMDRAAAEGFDGFLVKPADVARIDSLIQGAASAPKRPTSGTPPTSA
jgi:CheY-like chemotaxis protein